MVGESKRWLCFLYFIGFGGMQPHFDVTNHPLGSPTSPTLDLACVIRAMKNIDRSGDMGTLSLGLVRIKPISITLPKHTMFRSSSQRGSPRHFSFVRLTRF